MKLKDALRLSTPTQCLGRVAWTGNSSIIRLMSSARTLEEIKESLELTAESLNADDWNIYEIME